jgi:peptide/nickel transport system permease protein
MLVFTIRRVIGSILVLLVVSFITFMFTALTYDPLKPYTTHQPPLSKATLDHLRHQFHLDEPVLQRYWNWLTHLVHFDFTSWNFIRFNFGVDVQNSPVAAGIADRLELTTKMILGAIIVAALLAVVLGVISGVRHDKPFDVVTTILTFVLLALPTFWFAAVLKEGAIKFNRAVHDTVFYTIGTETPGISTYGTSGQIFRDRMLHLVLPVVSLGLLTASGWIRYQRASTIDVLDSEFMRLARAKGVRNRTVIRRHGLRNALIPLVTVMAIDIGALFGGAIITERVYDWNAMGNYLNTALTAEDTYAVVGWVMVSAIFVVLFNLLADLLYAALDPRIRLS